MTKMIRTAFAAVTLLCSLSARAALLQEFVKGATSRSVELTILDATTGVPTAGLAFNSSGIDLEYCREATACTDITEVTQTVGGAWTSGGFVSKGHGVYRLDVPDAALATGVNSVNIQGIITGYIVVGGTIKLVNYNAEDVVRLGLTAFPNVVSGSTGALPVIDANGNVQADVEAVDDDATSASGTVTFPNATLASTTNITAGTITTVTNLTNAPTAGDLTATMKTSVTTAASSATPALSTAGVNSILLGQGIPAPTTIATLASQTSFTLTAGSADDNAYNGYGIIIRDASTAAQQALGCVRDYTGSTRTVTLLENPGIFTMATTDNVTLLPAYCDNQVMQDLADTALLNCTIDTDNITETASLMACDLTDREGTAVTSANNKLTGLELVVLSGAQKYEGRFINSTSWDAANSELQITLDRALPGTLADNVTAIIR